MALNFLEMEKRSYSGEMLDKESWDLDRVAIPAAEIIDKYELEWDRTTLLPNDDAMCRNYYAAGREMLAASGVYNISTGRIVRFSEAEIDEGAANQKQCIKMGRGKDAFTLYARAPEDRRKPAVFGGNPGCPTPEAIFRACVRSWAQ